MMLALAVTAIAPVTVLAATDEVPFVDVTEDTPYYDAIVYCYKHGIFNGSDRNTFDPDDSMMRSTVVTVFANLTGIDINAYQQSSFDDVALAAK